MRSHSRAELEKSLRDKDIDAEISASLLDRFSELDLVDDVAFAEQWVSTRHRVKGLSRRALSDELRRKGVAADIVSDATQAVGHEDEVSAAEVLARKKLRAMASITDPVTIRRRLTGALARRGYGPDVIYRVLATVLDEEASPLDQA